MQIRNKSLLRTGYKKAHYRHLPVVLTHSTLDKCFYLAQRAVLTGVTKIVTVFCPLRYRMTLCLKSDDSAHLSYCFVYLIVLNETKKLNVDTNLSTTEHAFTESCEGYIYILL